MERFSHRDNVLLGYSPQRAYGGGGRGQSSSPKAPARDTEVDFNDVFGGPPRRSSSAVEVRSSFGESASTSSARGEEDRVSPRNPWSGLSEMPVFGEESSNRRRYPSDDFYDDIFRGDDSVNSPRRSEWDTSGSRAVLSPARRPLSQRADPYSTSLPAQFQLSLPEKSTNAEKYPAFSPGNYSSCTPKDPSSSGISPPISSKSSLSRNLSASLHEEDGLGSNTQPYYRPSPLSHEHSHESIDKSEELEPPDLKEDMKSTDALKDSYQFHFSIYRWASKGVPFSMPLRSSNSKGAVKIERCSTYHERVVSETMASGLQKAIWGDESGDLKLLNHSISSSKDAPDVEGRKLENNSFVKSISDLLQSDASRDNAVLSEKRKETNTESLSAKGLPKSSEKGVATNLQDMNRKDEEATTVSRSGMKPSGTGGEKTSRNSKVKGHIVKNTTESHSNSDVKRSVNKPTEKRADSNKVEVNLVDKPLPQGSSRKRNDNRGKNRDKGKVKDFVKIYNQEDPSETNPEVGIQSQKSQWRGTSTSRGDMEEIPNTTQTNRQLHVHNLEEIKPSPNPPVKVAKTLESENQQSHLKTTGFKLDRNASGQKDAPESSSKPLPDDPIVIIEDIDDILQENFTIKDISNDEEKQPQIEEGFEDIKVLDAKIQKWSNGKKGNIRSLLSTLQQVLWPGSGWKPVPLVGIIEGNAVKRSYQRAMLCLHPDKLQQKGAAARDSNTVPYRTVPPGS